MNRFRLRTSVIAASIVASFCSIALACNVPVFRFALEHWRPDPYRILIFHRGKLSDAQREMIRPLDAQQQKELANLEVETVDLDSESASEKSAADRALYEALGKPELPWFVVQYPRHLQIAKPAFAGPLSEAIVSAALDSPVRRELSQRLAAGETAVWLFLETGNPEQDDAAVALVQKQITELQSNLKLPELTDSPADALATTLPLEIKFSMIRVPRNVSEEQGLIALLIGSEPDLAERSDPMLFPIFGRGRALLPLIGAGITTQNIHDAAQFLAGPCSCEVKEQNPGFDLLLSVDWESVLRENGVEFTSIETRTSPRSAEPTLVPIPPGAKSAATTTPAPDPTVAPTPTPTSSAPLPEAPAVARTWFIAGGILCVVLIGCIALFRSSVV